MNKFKKSLIFLLISYQLIIGQTLVYAGSLNNGISSEERVLDDIDTLMKSADPSEIPFIDYLEDFTTDNTQPIKEYDLTEFLGKKVYIGYGIYDAGEKYCKFVEMPNAPEQDMSIPFDDFKVFNNRSYAISKDMMSYGACESLVQSYGGVVATPTNSGENSFIGSFSKNKWLGVFRPSCSDKYVNAEGKDQDFFNWSSEEDDNFCESTVLGVSQNKYTWTKSNSAENFYCPIEVNSPHIERPIKVCAPWWRIERKYTKPQNLEVGGINLGTINQADIPELYNVCTVLNVEGAVVAADKTTAEVTCTTYYDAMVSEGCIEDIYQNICYVSECQGYVENACFHKEEVVPLKDYTKITIQEAGNEKQIKGKAKIRTQVYECPITTPGSEMCLEKSTVIAYPKECPGSECQARKDCYFASTNSDERIACEETYSCEKLYPTLAITPTYEDGELKLLHKHCEDGTKLDFPVNIQNKLNKTCVEYSRILKTDDITKTCLLERTYVDYSLDVSITGVDNYENDPNCIRMNNLVESRPIEEALFEIRYHSSAFPTISKALVNETTELVNVPEDATDNYSVVGAQLKLLMADTNYGTTTVDNQIVDCPFAESWYTSIAKMLDASNALQIYDTGTIVEVTSTQTLAADCDAYKTSIGGTSSTFVGTTCTVTKTATADDQKFSRIQVTGSAGDPGEEYPLGKLTSKSNSVAVSDCEQWASCLQGRVTSNTSGGAVTCVVQQEEEVVTEPSPAQLVDEGTPTDCKPIANKESSANSEFDGLKDIFYIEDVVTGNFGYTSNYLTHLYQDNVVTVNGREAFPLERTSIIDDELQYHIKMHQTSILATEINPTVAAMGGATVAVAGASYAGAFGLTLAISMPVFAVIIVIVIVLVLLFQDETKYNEESIYWILYKDVPKTEYITNVYDYDGRLKQDIGTSWRLVYALSGEDPGENLLTDFLNFTGTLEVPDFNMMLSNLFDIKTQNWACIGFDVGSGIPPSDTMERGVVVRYPECDWYDINCYEEEEEVREDEKTFIKKMNGYYAGAVNAMSVIVPYIGDYEIEAYDQNNELLGSITILENDFLTETVTELANAQLNFGLNMSLSDGLEDGASEKACREDYMVEWGGGVSGIYAETRKTANSANCQKSNDRYLMDHSMVKLKIRSTSVEDWFVINLTRPMPYANRVRLVSLSNKETREYRCYDPFGDCELDDFVVTEAE